MGDGFCELVGGGRVLDPRRSDEIQVPTKAVDTDRVAMRASEHTDKTDHSATEPPVIAGSDQEVGCVTVSV